LSIFFYSYINDVLAEEAITFLIMELEECDYRTATGFAVFGTPTPTDTIYHDEWYELLDARKNRPSINDKKARERYDARIKTFLDDAPTALISFDDVPWPCDGDAQDMVAVMLTGEETPGTKIKRLKTIALFWHPDKFLSRFSKRLLEQDRERIIEGVLDISKEISRCLEREREEEYKNTKKIPSS